MQAELEELVPFVESKVSFLFGQLFLLETCLLPELMSIISKSCMSWIVAGLFWKAWLEAELGGFVACLGTMCGLWCSFSLYKCHIYMLV